MQCYIVIPKTYTDCLSGKVNFFKLGSPVLHKTIDSAMKDECYSSENAIVQIRFTNEEDLMWAVYAACNGGSHVEYNIEVLKVVSVKHFKECA